MTLGGHPIRSGRLFKQDIAKSSLSSKPVRLAKAKAKPITHDHPSNHPRGNKAVNKKSVCWGYSPL